ncbi:hypothetical protein RHSIM_Rhsim01G0162500 [Rhododendron simsii]|uniref:DUF4218 domain-containing protein n=1 Tax=Rhododendron simsii TaxID=118357 RepID=A0A834HML2_RHOSS|nr:hypothetical protein RHSIM_Rhsim01G0162500 [Rhododendron simsii]
MHIEKNICEALLGILLSIDGKNKDTEKARQDLEDMRIRLALHLKRLADGSFEKPPASYTLSPEERHGFYEFLKSIKYPDGYAANISRCVSTKGDKLTGLKSHDCHVLLQRLLPIGMRGYLPKDICITLTELGNFFQEICSKTLRVEDLEKLQDRIVLILCKMEKIFPPAFFDVMVHLAIHLPHEAMLGGPVQYRWMYPIERLLGTLKGFVTNRAYPEGSISEAYIVKECLTFCSMYLGNMETAFNRPERNVDDGDRGTGLAVFNQNVRPFAKMTRASNVTREEIDKAHWFVLNNSLELEQYLEEHKSILANESAFDISKRQQEKFPKWFKERMNQLRDEGLPEATEDLWSLANGPLVNVNIYSGCISNGIRFHTKDRDSHRKSQNSGVMVEGDHEGKTIGFYGNLCRVWELHYICGRRVVLFQCEWFNTGRSRFTKADAHFTSIDVRSRWYKNDPFVLPIQVKQVFYVNDTKFGDHWKVVERLQHRGIWDIPQRDDGLEPSDASATDVFQQEETTNAVPNIVVDDSVEVRLTRDDVDPEIIPRKMTNNKVMYIKPGKMAQQVPEYERKKREKMELNRLRMIELGYQKMANALFGSNKKRKAKHIMEAKNMRAQGNLSDEDYQQPEDAPEDEDDDEDTLSYTDDEELIDSMNARKKNAVAATLQTDQLPPIESTMALSLAQGSRPAPVTVAPTPTPTSTQELPIEQDGLSATAPLPQQMDRGIFYDKKRRKKLVLVLKRKKARSKVPFNHTMGSQSFASAMAAQTHKRGGQRPHIADFYSSTHYNQKKKKWVAPICEQLHLLLEARQKEDEARCQEADALGLPITMPQEEMPIEVLDKKFYVKEYGVSLKSSSSKRSSGKSHEEVRVLKNEVETLKDVCKQQNDQVETLKDLCQTQKETIQMQQEKINAYDEKFARFEAVMSAYMHGNPIGAGSNC